MQDNDYDNDYVSTSSVHRRGQRKSRWRVRRILGWVSTVLAGVMVVTSLGAYAAVRDLRANIDRKHVEGKLGDRPEEVSEATNILLIGSDTRRGKNSKYGSGIQGARADVMILLHLSPGKGGHNKASLFNFPRDTLVQIPSCQTRDGGTRPAHQGMLNSTLLIGGPACTMKTIEQMSQIYIDHFVQIDFVGFKHMINALGGIEVCVPHAVHDPDSGLDLPAGRSVVQGEQALAYVRTRKTLGNGGDLDRIDRQQKFLGAVVRKVTSKQILLNPNKLYAFLQAATKSVTTDTGLDIGEMRRLAQSVKGMNTGNITFGTVPVRAHPTNPARLLLEQPAADKLFTSIRNDKKQPAKKKKSSPDKNVPTLPPGRVKVQVLNGTTTPGLAGETATALRQRGFRVVDVGNARTHSHQQTLIRYAPSAKRGAATVAALAPEAKQKKASAAVASADVTLVLGQSWSGVSGSGSDAGSSQGQSEKPADDSPVPADGKVTSASKDTCG